ncbi:hypothetical protein BO94DRAFT_553523 [Aspergillus sclerotioniger CBS 115572]|uniref:Zn(2)-C6 fungal-type domain-containing protein n=1 Tax=Aspergillus sclerotioniger CBS 115572 TaxID=1450535 RepID=A0A317X7M6_9EURO|nr:hypothetical protein BO94DRAFT_553523 [Aspergillus sclerotioniger CBS 115572]PWY94614.1 hypothetical protein BO94DRAFT_553523 [Aspergillus sclerotioniger CBS 115572]
MADRKTQKASCSQCRSRKVRCDRRKHTCGNCHRLKHPCSFRTEAAFPSRPTRSEDDQPERRRGSRACINCRLQKVRCSGELPRCSNCQRRHRECHYPASERTDVVRVYPVKDGAELARILDDYFLHFFLHEPSIRRMCADRTLEPSLVLSICAMVKLHCKRGWPQPSESGLLVELSEKRIWDQLDKPSIFRLQALFLIIQYHAEVGGFERAFMMASIASRHVAALRLNHESPQLSFITQEIRRRAVWTMALLDGYFSVGIPGYSIINYEEIYQQFPCREERFGSPIPENIAVTRTEDNINGPRSMLELVLRISKLRRDIMRFTRQLALVEQPLKEFQDIVEGFRVNLSQLHERIILAVPLSAPIWPESRWVVRALEIQLAWRQANCDLFRLFLPGHPNAAPDVVLCPLEPDIYVGQARAICEEHSGWIVETISGAQKMDHRTLFSFDIARCAYQAARLGLFLGHMPDARSELKPDAAIANAALCLDFIKRNFASAAHARRMISDLSLLIGAYETRHGHLGAAMALDSFRSSGDAIERHNQLAVHSLIHQANFVDDSFLYEL